VLSETVSQILEGCGFSILRRLGGSMGEYRRKSLVS
jgi:hypothetical protein